MPLWSSCESNGNALLLRQVRQQRQSAAGCFSTWLNAKFGLRERVAVVQELT